MNKPLITSLLVNAVLLITTVIFAFRSHSVGLQRKEAANRLLDMAEIKLQEAKAASDETAQQIKEIQQKIWDVQKSMTNPPSSKTREIVYVSTPESRSEPKKIYSQGSVESEFDQIRKNDRNMTEAQFSEYAKPFIGKYIRWSGWVDAVEKDGSAYTVKIDMDPPSTLFSVYEIHLEGVDEYQAMRLRENQKITFAGSICRMSKDISLNIHLKSVTLY